MSESEARVTKVAGEFVVVEVDCPPSACGKCGERGGCGKPEAGPRRYALRNTVGAKVGDEVILSVPDGAVLKAAAFSYLMPLVFVIGGAAAGMAAFGDGLPAVAGAASGLFAGIGVLRLGNQRLAKSRESWLRLSLKR
jgi:sigma-E factor negative regulatory protein RseC